MNGKSENLEIDHVLPGEVHVRGKDGVDHD